MRRLYIRWFIDALDGSTQALPVYYLISLLVLVVGMTFAALYAATATAVYNGSPAAIQERSKLSVEQYVELRERSFNRLVLMEKGLRWGAAVAICITFCWMLSAYIRTRLMIEVAQTIQRVRALATKAELKPLFAAESGAR